MRAGLALEREDFIKVAEECADFLLSELVKDGDLLHRYREGSAEIPAFLEDYAYLIWALTDLYMATFEERWIRQAESLFEKAVELFRDRESGAFFQSREGDGDLFARKKEIYDGALPSGNSVMAYNLVRLSKVLDRPELEKMAGEILSSFSQILSSYPSAHTFSMIVLDLLINGGFEIRAKGDPARAKGELVSLQKEFLPEGIFVIVPSTDADGVSYMLCRNRVCEVPQDSIEGIKKRLLEGVSTSGA